MIPSIETIAEDLAAGRINIAQAIVWLHQHAEGSANELRDHFAGLALSHQYAYHDSDAAKAAEWAYQLADAMLAARSAR